MGKSYRKTPIRSFTTAQSEKKDKQICNKRVRLKSKQILNSLEDYDEYLEPLQDECFNLYSMAKDGKMWFGYDEKYKDLRRK